MFSIPVISMKRLNRIYFRENMSEKEDMAEDAQGANI